MKAMKSWVLGIAIVAAALIPLQSASAWDRGDGHWGRGGYHGSYGGHGGYHGSYGGHGGYHGGYGGYRGGYGCRNCGAAVVGLAVGTIVGAAIANAYQPPVVVTAPPPRRTCQSVWVNGVSYYNCDRYYRPPYDVDY